MRQAFSGLPFTDDDGVRVEFFVSSDKRRGHYFDLDNMAKVVFDALGHPPVKFVHLERAVCSNPGVVLTIGGPSPSFALPPIWMPALLRSGSFRDPVPHPALDGAAPIPGDTPLFVHLCVHEPEPITNFDLSGYIKTTVDHLWPVIGGDAHAPKDHRVHRLVLTRSDGRPSGVSIGIRPLETQVKPDAERGGADPRPKTARSALGL